MADVEGGGKGVVVGSVACGGSLVEVESMGPAGPEIGEERMIVGE